MKDRNVLAPPSMTHYLRSKREIKPRRNYTRDAVHFLLLAAGLILAISEGPYVPWPNLAGLVCLGAVAWLARRTT